jgi:hypothetical protein
MASTAFYTYPVTGVPFTGTTAPTTAQALLFNSLAVTAFYGDTDTTLTITHNWGLSTTALQFSAPWVIVYPQTTAAVTVSLAVVSLATNSLVLNKNSQSGSAGLFTVILQRPFLAAATPMSVL